MDPQREGPEPPHIQHALDALAALEAHRAARGDSGDLQREIAQLVLDLHCLAEENCLLWGEIRKRAKAGYRDVQDHSPPPGFGTAAEFPVGSRVRVMWPGADTHGRLGTVTGVINAGVGQSRQVQLDGEPGMRGYAHFHLRNAPAAPKSGPTTEFAPGDHVGWQSDPHENPGRYLDATVLEVGREFVSIQTHGSWGTSPVKLIVPPRELVKYGPPLAPGLDPLGLQLDDRVAVKAPHRRQGQTGRVIGRSPSSIDVRFDDGFADTFAREALLLVRGAETPPDPAPAPNPHHVWHIGDRVELHQAGHDCDGQQGTITEIADARVRVRFPFAPIVAPWWIDPTYLRAAPQAPQ